MVIYFLTNLILTIVGQGSGTPTQVLFAPPTGPQVKKDVFPVWSVMIVELPLTLLSLHFNEEIQAVQTAALQNGGSLTNAVNITALWDTAYIEAYIGNNDYTGNIIIRQFEHFLTWERSPSMSTE
jgi:hypothetical protein